MIHRNIWCVPLVALTLVASACGTSTPSSGNDASPKDDAPSAAQHTTELSYPGKDGASALELLRKRADVRTEKSSLGEYVTSIDGTAATKSSYWMFYVDGVAATTGADAYETHDGERIEWRYES